VASPEASGPWVPLVSRLSVYTSLGAFAQHGDVKVERAIDPLTGLTVLLYRFRGTARSGAAALRSPDVWRLVDHGVDDEGRGFAVTHVVKGASSVAERPAALDDEVVLRAFAVLAEAALAGLVHGDLGAHRLIRRGDDVALEGYGVPWADITPQDDARHLAGSLLALSGHALSERALDALAQAAEDGDAAALCRSLGAYEHAEAVPAHADDLEANPAGSVEDATRGADVDAPDDEGDPSAAAVDAEDAMDDEGEAAVAAATSARDDGAPQPAPAPELERPRVVIERRSAAPAAADEGLVTSARRSWRFPGSVVAKGATRRAITLPTTLQGHRLLLAALLLVGLAVLLVLVNIVRSREGTGSAAPPAQATVTGRAPAVPVVVGVYPVDVLVAPDRLPPVALVVVASPPGSRHAPGTVLRTVPDRVILDQSGSWQLQGRIDARRSAIVTIVVPRDTSVTLSFPDTP
jgi:hypothetical protein